MSLTLADERPNPFVHDVDVALDRNDVHVPGSIDVIDKGRHQCALAALAGSRHQQQTFGLLDEPLDLS